VTNGLRRLLTTALFCALSAAPARAALLPADEILTEDRLQAGMRGYAKTVFHGTRVERFDITVLGVLEKIDFGGNLILIRIDSGPVVSERLGMVSGMSGSPVYVEGRLIGAIAYAFAFAKTPVAGVTPIRQMLEAFEPGAAPARKAASGALRPRAGEIRVAGRSFSRVVVAGDPVAAGGDAATMCLTPIATPVMVSGASREGLRRLDDLLSRHHLAVMAGPGGGAQAGPAPPLEPGAAVGAQLISGDLDVTAVGTVTAVIGDTVIAFGHPLMELGAVDIPLTGAYVHAILPSYYASSKLASPTQPLGRFTQDRTWCIGGLLGKPARTVPTDLVVRDLDRDVTRRYAVAVLRHRDLTAELVYVSALSALASIGSPFDGTVESSVRIRPAGMDPIVMRNTFAPPRQTSLFSLLFDGDMFAMLPLGDLMRVLEALQDNPFGPVGLESVSVEAGVTTKRRSAAVERVYADRLMVRPGDTVRVGVVIQPFGEPRTERHLTLQVPERAPSGRLRIGVVGGGSVRRQQERLGLRRPEPRSAEEYIRRVADRPATTELVADVVPATGGLTLAGHRLDSLPPGVIAAVAGAPMLDAQVTRGSDRVRMPVPWPLSGADVITLVVETDEEEKAGRTPPPQTGGWFEEEDGFEYFFESLFRSGAMTGFRLPSTWVRADDFEEDIEWDDDSDEAEMPSWEEVEELSEADFQDITGGDLGGSSSAARTTSLARPPEVWEQTSQQDFADGKFEGAAVTTDGTVTPAPRAHPVWRDTEALLWCQAADGEGNLYLGAWGSGAVLRLGADGETEAVFESQEAAVTALAFDPQGALLAAGAPSGSIYRIADGRSQTWCRLDDPYVWALGFGADGLLYAATGPRGRVYAVDSEGRARVALQTPDRHVTALAVDGAGVVYCGTSPRGKVYRIGLEGEAAAIFETPEAAVRCLAADGAGNVYVGTSPKGRVYRVTPQGAADLLFQSRGRQISALLARGDAVYAAGGQSKACIYRIASPRSAATVAELDGTEVVSLAADGERGLTALLAPSSRVVRLAPAADAGGRFVSSVLDAGGVADWGAITWGVQPAADASLALRTRTGNTAYPDETWSPWSGAYAIGDGVASPAGRYLQYCVDFAPDSAAALQYVKVFRLNRNRPPEVTITEPEGGALWSGEQEIEWKAKDPDEDTLTFEVFASADAGSTWKRLRESAGEEEEDESPAEADDETEEMEENGAADGDDESPADAEEDPPGIERLREVFEAKAGPEGEEEEPEAPEPEAPKPPAKELKSKSLEWDTALEKDGAYLIKVVASDAGANPTDPKTAEAVSEPLAVDNTPPELVLTGARGRLREPEFGYRCRDAGSYVASAEYRVDEGKWLAAAAADRVFDSPEEEIRIPPANLPSGAHTLEIRLRDGAGNEKTFEIGYRRKAS